MIIGSRGFSIDLVVNRKHSDSITTMIWGIPKTSIIASYYQIIWLFIGFSYMDSDILSRG